MRKIDAYLFLFDKSIGNVYNTYDNTLEGRYIMSPERKKAMQNLKTVRGQIDGIIKMLEEDRYCMDISNQISASTSLLKKANMHILSGHLHSCVKSAMQEEDMHEKIKEIEDVLMKLMK